MIHRFILNGFYLALDVHSGAVHVLDPLSYELLGLIQPPMAPECPESCYAQLPHDSRAQIDEAYGELYSLYREGLLFSADDYEQFSHMMTSAPIKAMCLHVAHDCNLRCKYCFAETGEYGGGRKLMSAETGKKAIDFLIEHSGTRRNIELDFFGGEPLMNFGVVQEVVSYARSLEAKHHKNFRFTITTNGVLLNQEKADYINREMSNCVLSLDGRPEVNDRMRPYPNGQGSYSTILDKFRYLVKHRGEKDYYVRGTFTKYNLDFSKDVLHIYRQGFDQLSVEPVVCDPSCDYAITEQDLPQIFMEYETLAKDILELKKQGSAINFFHFMIDLNQGPCALKRLRGCGCGNEYVAVSPEGDIYPCHQFVGNEEWKMGNLHDHTLDRDRKEYFAKTTLYDKEDCQDCWAKFYCSGGCNANNQQYCGSVFKPYKLSCEMERKRLECALMIQAALAQEEDAEVE